MGKAIVIGSVVLIIALAVIGAGVWARSRASKDAKDRATGYRSGDLDAKQELVLMGRVVQADTIFRSLLAPVHSLTTDNTILSQSHRAQIEAWLARNDSPTATRKASKS